MASDRLVAVLTGGNPSSMSMVLMTALRGRTYRLYIQQRTLDIMRLHLSLVESDPYDWAPVITEQVELF